MAKESERRKSGPSIATRRKKSGASRTTAKKGLTKEQASDDPPVYLDMTFDEALRFLVTPKKK